MLGYYARGCSRSRNPVSLTECCLLLGGRLSVGDQRLEAAVRNVQVLLKILRVPSVFRVGRSEKGSQYTLDLPFGVVLNSAD